MCRSRVAVRATVVALMCAAVGAVSVAGDVPGRRILPGGTVTGQVDFAGDVDDVTFPALPGMTFRATADGAKLRVSDAYERAFGAGPARPSVVANIREAGEYRLTIEGAGHGGGAYEVRTAVTYPPTARARARTLRAKEDSQRAAPAGLRAVLDVDMLEGATLYAFARPARRTPVVGMTLVQPDGTRIDLSGFTFVNGLRVTQLPGYRVSQSGRYQLELTGFSRRGQPVRLNVVPWQPGVGGTLAHTEALLDPGAAPAGATLTYRLDPGLVIAGSGRPVFISTTTESGEDTGAGVTLESVRPDFTQLGFLSVHVPAPLAERPYRHAGEPEPYAPFVLRPGDLPAGEVVIDARRIALGVAALHPWLSRLTPPDREAFFDGAPSAPSFEYLAAAVREALATEPLVLSDATRFPEVFKAAGKVVEETFASLWGDSFEDLRVANGVPDGLTLLGSDDGTAQFVNPRALFYGLRIDDSRGSRLGLVPPSAARVTQWPAPPGAPGTLLLRPLPGRTDFRADALLPPTTDLTTPGGMGTTANGLHALFAFYFQASPWPMPVSPADLAGMTTEYLARSGPVPAGSELLGHLGDALAQDDPAAMFDALASIVDDHWPDVSRWIWQGEPGAPTAPCHCGAAKFVYGFTTANALQDAAPSLYDLVRLRGEGELRFAATRHGPTVTSDPETPFSFLPDFGWTPGDAVIGEPVSFDPSATVFTAPPETLAFRWSIWDAPGEPPVVLDGSVATLAAGGGVDYAFTTTGFHRVTLDVTANGVTQQAVRTVYVSAFMNLGFEDGTTDGWLVETHFWHDPTPGSGPYLSAVVAPGADPIASALPTVFSGAHALRINDDSGSYHISAATRTIHVPEGGTIMKFAWAAVLEDPSHPAEAQPYFDIRVTDETTSTVLYTIHHYSNEPGYPWQPADWGGWLFVPWQPVTLDLTALGGHDVTISAIAADCDYGGHGGYVYLDAP